MGVLAPGSVHARPSAQPPIDTSGIFLVQVSWRGGQQMLTHKIWPRPPPGPLGTIFRFLLGFFENFEGDSAETCAGKFPLMSMGGWAEGLACADPGARTPIGVSGIFASVRPSICVEFFMTYHQISSLVILGTKCTLKRTFICVNISIMKWVVLSSRLRTLYGEKLIEIKILQKWVKPAGLSDTNKPCPCHFALNKVCGQTTEIPYLAQFCSYQLEN